MPASPVSPTFGKYVLLRRVATGGMAEIFRAVAFGAEGFRKQVAIKRLLPNLTGDAKFVTMFTDEARLAAHLNHTNIVEIYDFGVQDEMLYHAMEYVHGADLSQIVRALLERDLPPPLPVACHILIEALYGLDHAHQQRDGAGQPLNIIHRDMSPSNILVSFDGEVKITDFGIAKASQTTTRTAGGVIKGKYRYMSPEQAHGWVLDQRTDLFSIGACLYEILTLQMLYPGKNELEVLASARESRWVPPRQLQPNLPAELEEIVMRALVTDRVQRWPSASALRDALERYVQSHSLQLPRASLADFMRGLFATRIRQQQVELAQEAEITSRIEADEADIPLLDPALAAQLVTMLSAEADSEDSPVALPATAPLVYLPSYREAYDLEEDSTARVIRPRGQAPDEATARRFPRAAQRPRKIKSTSVPLSQRPTQPSMPAAGSRPTTPQPPDAEPESTDPAFEEMPTRPERERPLAVRRTEPSLPKAGKPDGDKQD